MTELARIAAVVTAAAALVAAALGAWPWGAGGPSRALWVACRAAQALAVAQALLAGVLFLAGFEPADRLYWLYALLPVAVSFVGEQLRLLSAQTVLDARGLQDAQAVGRLPEAGREPGVLGRVGAPRGG